MTWGDDVGRFNLIARNVSMKYAAMGVDWVLGFAMLPFNLAHLGQSSYGLWMIIASITVYFSMLDLGFGGAQVKFAAQYRAQRDSQSLNEISSTMFFVYGAISLAAYAIAVLLAFNLENFFKITAEQASTGRSVLLIVSVYVALGFPFSVFGAIVNGFMRPYLNGMIAIATSVGVAIANVVVLLAGYGLVELVIATTAVRVLSCFAYRINAYRVFPALRIRFSNFRRERLRELGGFSAYVLLIDLANKLNYQTDVMVVGAFINPAAVAAYAVAQRLCDLTQRLSNQLNTAVFPMVVDSATAGRSEQLRTVFLEGTRTSLVMVIPFAAGLAALAEPLIALWVGPQFGESVTVIYFLAVVVSVRVGSATARTILKGAGQHRLLAFTNVGTGLANLVLSVMLVQRMGLIGVALGTLIPLALTSVFVIFPAACRRVGMPIGRAISTAVFPTVWPAVLVALMLVFSRAYIGNSKVVLLVQAGLGGLLYLAVFLRFAISNGERQWYLSKMKQLRRRRQPRVAPAV